MRYLILFIQWFCRLFARRVDEPAVTVTETRVRGRSMTPCKIPLYASGTPPMGRVIPLNPRLRAPRVPRFDEPDTIPDRPA